MGRPRRSAVVGAVAAVAAVAIATTTTDAAGVATLAGGHADPAPPAVVASNGPVRDRLLLIGGRRHAGERVYVVRHRSTGGTHVVRRATLGDAGRVRVVIWDHNGPRPTTYTVSASYSPFVTRVRVR